MVEPNLPEQPPVMPGAGVEAIEKQEVKTKEQLPEVKKDSVLEPTMPSVSAPSVTATPVPKAEVVKNETLQEIEHIMEDDLSDVYATLPPDKKAEFVKVGEETAAEIEGMLYHVKVKSKKIFKLLFQWMKVIPGVNNYFLKQEAKTKTDEIMHLKETIDADQKNIT